MADDKTEDSESSVETIYEGALDYIIISVTLIILIIIILLLYFLLKLLNI